MGAEGKQGGELVGCRAVSSCSRSGLKHEGRSSPAQCCLAAGRTKAHISQTHTGMQDFHVLFRMMHPAEGLAAAMRTSLSGSGGW